MPLFDTAFFHFRAPRLLIFDFLAAFDIISPFITLSPLSPYYAVYAIIYAADIRAFAAMPPPLRCFAFFLAAAIRYRQMFAIHVAA